MKVEAHHVANRLEAALGEHGVDYNRCPDAAHHLNDILAEVKNIDLDNPKLGKPNSMAR